MTGGERAAQFGGIALAVFFLLAATQSVLRRAQSFADYPAYSSFNNADNGVKAIYESWRRLGFDVSRNYEPLYKLNGKKVSVVYAGAAAASFRHLGRKDFELFEHLAQQGNRLVIALDVKDELVRVKEEAQPQRKESTAGKKGDEKDEEPPDNLKERWGVTLAPSDVITIPKYSAGGKLEHVNRTWRIAAAGPAWTPFPGEGQILLERRFGKGSVLLLAGAHLLTNRELLTKPDSPLLAALAGPYRGIVFDESHLGLEDTGTIASLAKAHHLEWMLLGFLVLSILYVWRSAVSFVPPVAVARDTAVKGHDAYDALTNLLIRSIPPRQILRAIGVEWNRSRRFSGARTLPAFDEAELARLSRVSPKMAAQEYERLTKRIRAKLVS